MSRGGEGRGNLAFFVPWRPRTHSLALGTICGENLCPGNSVSPLATDCAFWEGWTYADHLYFAVWSDGEPVFTITSTERM